MKLVYAYGGAALAFIVLDAIWLTLMAGPLYRAHLGPQLLEGFRPAPAVLFYALYLAGVVYFAVMPALERGALGVALVNGAILGLICYATYDLTNQATLKVWSTTVTVADMLWGSFVTSMGALAGTYVAMRFG